MNNIVESLKEFFPSYETILPFSKEKVIFKPFKVKDAKNLSLILQENNKALALKNMIDLISTYSEGIVVENLCLADAEYLFLQIRSKSVDEVLNLIYNNEKIQVFISDIKVKNEIVNEKIELGSNIVLYLKTPTVKDLLKLNSLEKEELIKACIEKVTSKNEVYSLNKFVTKEIQDLIDNLPMSVIPKFEKFLKSQPELYINLKSNNDEKEVSGLLNFFIFR